MNNNFFFSIGIPAYKERYLKECIDSILIQTYTNFELIIVNDYSPDAIDELIDTYTDKRIHYYKNDENIGAENVIDNWNKCLNYAKGEYFVLMGDDDKMESNYLEEFIKLIDKYPTLDVYHCRSKIIDENSVPLKLSPSCPEYETTYNYLWHVLTSKREQFISDFVYRTSALIEMDGFYKLPLAWVSDYVTAFIASGDKGIAHTYKPLFNYRRSNYNITSTGSIDLKRQAVLGFEKWLSVFLNQLPVKEEDKIIYTALGEAFKKTSKHYKSYFIKQKIKEQGFKGLISCLTHQRHYLIKPKDILIAVGVIVSDKLLN